MNLPELFRIPGIIQGLTAELFARQIERAITDDVIAVEISGLEWDSENFSAENVLCKE